MAEILPPGTPIWVDLGSPDVEASRRYHAELFGWTSDEPNEEFGGYTMFWNNGKMVAGLGPLMSPGQPPAWSTYVHVTDADATAARAKAAGGQVIVEPMDVGDTGRFAVLMDPTGAAIGLWQPKQHTGAQQFNSPVSLSWNELTTRDPERAKSFYRDVFGWDPHTSGEAGQEYTEFKLNGESVAGMMRTPEQVPAEVPPYWLPYFAVADCAATVEKNKQLGGQVMMPAMDIPQGTFAVLTDPNGAAFAVIQLKRG